MIPNSAVFPQSDGFLSSTWPLHFHELLLGTLSGWVLLGEFFVFWRCFGDVRFSFFIDWGVLFGFLYSQVCSWSGRSRPTHDKSLLESFVVSLRLSPVFS